VVYLIFVVVSCAELCCYFSSKENCDFIKELTAPEIDLLVDPLWKVQIAVIGAVPM
jgi:hypothetical protein